MEAGLRMEGREGAKGRETEGEKARGTGRKREREGAPVRETVRER